MSDRLSSTNDPGRRGAVAGPLLHETGAASGRTRPVGLLLSAAGRYYASIGPVYEICSLLDSIDEKGSAPNDETMGPRRRPPQIARTIPKASLGRGLAVFVVRLPHRPDQAPNGQPQWRPPAAFPTCCMPLATALGGHVADDILTHRPASRPAFAGRRQDDGSRSETLSPQTRCSWDNATLVKASAASRVGKLRLTFQFYAIDANSTPATCWHSTDRGAKAVVSQARKPAANMVMSGKKPLRNAAFGVLSARHRGPRLLNCRVVSRTRAGARITVATTTLAADSSLRICAT